MDNSSRLNTPPIYFSTQQICKLAAKFIADFAIYQAIPPCQSKKPKDPDIVFAHPGNVMRMFDHESVHFQAYDRGAVLVDQADSPGIPNAKG
jgi:hypothetical protein